MSRSLGPVGLALLGLCASPAAAQSRQYVDLQGGLGYSSNPLLVAGGDGGGYARVSANAVSSWQTERSETSLSAYVSNDTYFNDLGSRQAFDLGASTSRRLSELLQASASISFAGDYGGQLSSRFYGPAPTVAPPETVTPPLVAGPSVIIVDPDLLTFSQRTYRLSGQVGLGLRLSEVSSMSASAGATHLWQRNSDDSTFYNGSLGYNRQLSERVGIGLRGIASVSEFGSGQRSTSFGPQATLSAQLSPNWSLSAAAGVVRTRIEDSRVGLADVSYDLSGDASLCRQAEFDRFCVSASRSSQTGLLNSGPATTASISYYRKLSRRDGLQLSASLLRAEAGRIATADSAYTFYTASAGYDRQIGTRMSAGANLVARQRSVAGQSIRADVGGTVYLRYRLGDLL